MTDLITNALTIDVEDAVNQAMRNIFRTEMEPTIRVLNNTVRFLDLLSQYNTKATFFILGEVARTYPALIRRIAEHGHELGIHGYSHDRYYNMTPEKAKEEILSSKHLIEDITGVAVIGHRAPEFSIGKNTLWVLDILLDAGIKYDSSIFPVRSDRYGWPGFVKEIGYLDLADGRKIIEAPLSVVNILGREFPSCGGGYLRAFPYFFTDLAFRQIMKQR
ncbi:MAG: polysaccharide deacetylase family protein, partial [Bacteroidales bacterium]|nr:polysaccharide deacetylase family protein [Bacteroidales bacterium]